MATQDLQLSKEIKQKKSDNNLRTAELEGILWIMESSPSQGGPVGNHTPNLWLHRQMLKPLNYPAVDFPQQKIIHSKHLAAAFNNNLCALTEWTEKTAH